MKSRIVSRVLLLVACAAPLAARADDVASDAALRASLTKAVDAKVQPHIMAATTDAGLPSATPAASKSEHVQPLREPPADVAVLEVRPDSGTCFASLTQDHGC